MGESIREYWKNNFKHGLASAWDWMGAKGVIIDIGIGLGVGLIISGTFPERWRVIIVAGVTILVAFFVFFIIFIYFSIIAEPYNIILKQRNLISKMIKEDTDRDLYRLELMGASEEGEYLRTRGFIRKENEKSWGFFEDWDSRIGEAIAYFDMELANKWNEIEPKPIIEQDIEFITPEHGKLIGLFDAKLGCLDEIIEEMRASHYF